MRRHIRNVKIGDKVKVYNVEENTFDISSVSQLYKHQSNHYYVLNGSIRVTGGHPFYVKDDSEKGYSWVQVSDLKAGDKLFTKQGKVSKLKSIKRVDNPMVVYNLEVDGEHNYFAAGFLVHNKGGVGSALGSYWGNDDESSAARASINSAVTDWNETPLEAMDALNIAGEAITGAANAEGTVRETMVELGETVTTRTGAIKTLHDDLMEANEARVDARKSAGETFRESQATAANSLNLSGVIGPAEKQAMTAQSALATEVAEADTAATAASLRANQEFRDANEGSITENVIPKASGVIGEYKNAIDLEKTSMENAYLEVDDLGSEERRNVTPLAKLDGGYNDTNDVTSFSDEFGGLKAGATTTNEGIKWASSGTLFDAFEKVNQNVGAGLNANALPTPEQKDSTAFKAVSEIWTGGGTGTPVIALRGKGGQGIGGDTSGGSSGSDAYVQSECFAGNTFIEVIE